MSTDNILVYDVSGGPYMTGVNNFTLLNVFTALREAEIVKRFNLIIKAHVAVYDNLALANMIEYLPDNVMKWYLFTLTIDEQSDTHQSVVDSLITSPCGKQVILRTREY